MLGEDLEYLQDVGLMSTWLPTLRLIFSRVLWIPADSQRGQARDGGFLAVGEVEVELFLWRSWENYTASLAGTGAVMGPRGLLPGRLRGDRWEEVEFQSLIGSDSGS